MADLVALPAAAGGSRTGARLTTMAVYGEALERCHAWLDEARRAGLAEPAAMTLATARAQGGTSARTVLLKHLDERGFVFYTNTRSRKSRQIEADSRVALCFLWASLKHQILVEGTASPVGAGEADAYWRTRPRESQLGAWASRQSEPLRDASELQERFHDYEARFAGQEVPRPAHWSGYRVAPDMIEFWSGRDARLHERLRYSKSKQGWIKQLLNP